MAVLIARSNNVNQILEHPDGSRFSALQLALKPISNGHAVSINPQALVNFRVQAEILSLLILKLDGMPVIAGVDIISNARNFFEGHPYSIMIRRAVCLRFGTAIYPSIVNFGPSNHGRQFYSEFFKSWTKRQLHAFVNLSDSLGIKLQLGAIPDFFDNFDANLLR